MNLHRAAQQALRLMDADAKAEACESLWHDWSASRLSIEPYSENEACFEAGRPPRPQLVPPRVLPMRKLNGPRGHAAFLHALVHIEFNAINLALDAVYRFRDMPTLFYADWLQVAKEEAEHFRMLRAHLRHFGYDYGDFPAHDGLWALAVRTAADPLARMALVPRLMEARGLDVTPALREKLLGFGDRAGAAILERILRDEIGHVAAGDRWFRWLCAQRGLDAQTAYIELIIDYDAPRPRRPFNELARQAAGFSALELKQLADMETRLRRKDHRPLDRLT